MSLAPPATLASPGQRRPQGSLQSFPQPFRDPGAHALQVSVKCDIPHQPDDTHQLQVRGTEAQMGGADLFQGW